MKKDITRDYITEILRAYARQESVATTAHVHIKASPSFMDFAAVYNTLETLDKSDRGYIAKAIEAVYFVNPFDELRKGDISTRVLSYANSVPTDERTVYRWLKEGRRLCAEFRGLSINL